MKLFQLRIRLLALSLFLVVLLAGVSVALAIDPEEDGRINAWATIGGNAIYCVDEDMNPIAHWTEGGIRVLNINGEEVLFVPSETIADVGDTPVENILLGEANGLSLYRLVGGGFQLNGIDEHGEPFEFIFYDCLPIKPIPNSYVNEDCPPIIIYVGKPSVTTVKDKLTAIPPSLIQVGDCVVIIPCLPNKALHKRETVVFGGC